MDWAQKLAATASCAATQHGLLAAAAEQVATTFDAPIIGMFPTHCLDEFAVIRVGLRLPHVREYIDSWRSRDRVLLAALAERVAIRDDDVRAPMISYDFASLFGGGPYMVAPLYGADGDVLATLHVWRKASGQPFDLRDVRRACAFTAFLSAMLAARPVRDHLSHPVALAPREHQVAVLASRGLSNPAIAKQLGLAPETIKQTLRRVYSKANVSNRVELARQFERCGRS